MGQIRIDVTGSFSPNCGATFTAIGHGHADCVAQVIEYLARVILPRAIQQDHFLHDENHRPVGGFGRPKVTEE